MSPFVSPEFVAGFLMGASMSAGLFILTLVGLVFEGIQLLRGKRG